MVSRWHLTSAAWTLVDQGIVSAGGLLVNIFLARTLAPAEYGAYALLYGGMLSLQLFNQTLLFHPLSLRVPVAAPAEQRRLLCCGLLLTLALSGGLALLLSVVLALAGLGALIPAALCCFLSWQVQEAFRRGLFATFRHRGACIGDAVSYLGQVAVALVLARAELLTLESALYAMALTSTLAALIQALQFGFAFTRRLHLRRTVADFWALGGLWALGNGLLAQMRVQVLPWLLALAAGTPAAAAFQAATNVVNLSNPVIMGLCNIIPSTAARVHEHGHAAAWRASRVFMLLAVPPLVSYAVLILAFPDWMLWLFYGAASDYAGMGAVVQLLVLGSLAGHGPDLLNAFLHGVGAAPRAFMLNAIGAAVALTLAWPMISTFGLAGGALALLAANLVRLVASGMLLRVMAAAEAPRHA